MIHTLYRTKDGKIQRDLIPEQLVSALQDADGLLWVDLFKEPIEVCAPLLRETFGFHPLAVEDALEETHVPKVDDWGQYIYAVLHSVTFDQEKDELVQTQELDVFLGKNYLVTYRTQPILAVDRVWSACERDERYLQKGVARLLYKVVDEVVADYLPVVEEMDEAIDNIEDHVFDHPTPAMLEDIFALKRALLHLRRTLMPQREVLNKLARGDYAVVDPADRVFFRDVYDHLVRLHDITEGLRDLVGGALDTYLSVVSNRMNEVMKVLTVITTMFMPISFLSGFFGMNFFQPVLDLPVWTGPVAFAVMLAAVLMIPIGMYWWMRRREWM
ncbi:MAG TPA: magnesium/cobalt transporter CorA [Anaerolineae bacterium]|nr:magnesium/cobalt transporter CorA [Anaerolineae bacterium]